MGKLSRTKGKNGELEFIKEIRPVWPKAARELVQYQKTLGRDIKDTKPFCIQVKRTKKEAAIASVLKEADSAKDEVYTIPVAAQRGDNGKWIVSMYLDDWLWLVSGEING